MFDVAKFVHELHDYIGRAVAPLAERIKAADARQSESDKEFVREIESSFRGNER